VFSVVHLVYLFAYGSKFERPTEKIQLLLNHIWVTLWRVIIKLEPRIRLVAHQSNFAFTADEEKDV